MTNNPTIDGVSRELLQKVDDLMYIMTGHDSYPRLKHKYGEQWWAPVNELRAELCKALAAPVVEQPITQILSDELAGLFTKGFLDDRMVSDIVAVVRKYSAPVVERHPFAYYFKFARYTTCDGPQGWSTEIEFEKPADFLFADGRVKDFTPLYKEPPELAELQATIANLDSNLFRQSEQIVRLTAENERLKAGQGEAVGEAGSMPGTTGFTMAAFEAEKVPIGTKLYTSQPAPVSVVLPERSNERDHAGDFTYEAKAWNACLDKVKELNQ